MKLTTLENAKIFCANPPSDNPPKRGEEYYFESSNYLSFAEEIQHPIFTPNSFAKKLYFTIYQEILIDGVYKNQHGLFVGYWYKNGAYRTCRISAIKRINQT